jgi:hypothetical protein
MAVFLSKKMMSYLLSDAMEGGSTYWCQRADYIMPPGMTKEQLRAEAWAAAPEDERDLWSSEGATGRWPLYAFLPFLPPKIEWQMKFIPGDDGGVPVKPGILTPRSMRDAAPKLLELNAKSFKRIKEDNWDANDSDNWLQAAIFGEIVFG